MIPIFIDTRTVGETLDISYAQARGLVDYVVKETATAFALEWGVTAAMNLKSARNQYVSSIVMQDMGWGKAAVVLLGWLPNAIESGYPAFDMKIGLLNGRNARSYVDKDGDVIRYNTVPYRFAVPSSIGESEVFTGKMPEVIHEIIKEKPANIPVGFGFASEPIKASELPVGYNEPLIKAVPKLEPTPLAFKAYYQHKSPIHEGIRKVKDAVTGQNRYQSFRRVSDNSEPEAWIHPGFQAANLASKAEQEMNMEFTIGQNIDNYLKQIGIA